MLLSFKYTLPDTRVESVLADNDDLDVELCTEELDDVTDEDENEETLDATVDTDDDDDNVDNDDELTEGIELAAEDDI